MVCVDPQSGFRAFRTASLLYRAFFGCGADPHWRSTGLAYTDSSGACSSFAALSPATGPETVPPRCRMPRRQAIKQTRSTSLVFNDTAQRKGHFLADDIYRSDRQVDCRFTGERRNAWRTRVSNDLSYRPAHIPEYTSFLFSNLCFSLR